MSFAQPDIEAGKRAPSVAELRRAGRKDLHLRVCEYVLDVLVKITPDCRHAVCITSIYVDLIANVNVVRRALKHEGRRFREGALGS